MAISVHPAGWFIKGRFVRNEGEVARSDARRLRLRNALVVGIARSHRELLDDLTEGCASKGNILL